MTVKTPAQISFQQGKQQRRQGNLAASIDCFRETIRLQADFVPAYNNLANALQADGQIEPAIALYQQALLLAPDMAVLHCNLASLWQLQGEHQRAITVYQQAIALNPDFFWRTIIWAKPWSLKVILPKR
ncbi:MAG: tetratricopeptide repeat protein [Methylobacter sp.]|uniref:Tetratricopeptide repeat protein n=1 Tax=Candidatus Methylobacter titanis TaxID=3053457 RepID=A0AA43Q5A2_9GAMM|nr:tetratricopeptide repeat protein [Candidatus Methylobacter titanis]MDI1292248.1 tetratricopeptide repeat protein [Candidatus Methylobacter titanis]